ncbi:MAG TPA: MFS transporter [Acidimicrobiales bacterium]|nr:MFS transporter [Acidimicrobiales bacterium]
MPDIVSPRGPAAARSGAPGRGLAATVTVSFGSFVLVTSEFLPIGLLPRIARDFDVSVGTAGFMVTVTGLVAAFAAPGINLLGGRLDRRWLLLGLTTLLVVSDLLVATASNFPVALAARILLGTGVGGFWSVAPSLGPRLVAREEAPKAVAIIGAGGALGAVAGLPVGELVGQLSGWRTAFWGGAGLALLALLFELWLLPSLPTRQRGRVADLLGAARSPAARIGLVAASLTAGGNFAAYTFITPYLERSAHISPGWVSVVLVGFGTAGIVGNFAGSAAAGRRIVASLLTATLGMTVTIGLLVAVTGPTAIVVILVAGWGVTWGAWPIVMQLWMMRASPGAHEQALALFMFVVQLSLAGGALAGGVAVNSFGLLSAFGIGAAITLVSAAIVITLLRLGTGRGVAGGLSGHLADGHLADGHPAEASAAPTA